MLRWIPKIISLIFLWGAVVATLVFVEPNLIRDILIPGSYLPFFVLIEITLWYTIGSFVIASTVVLAVFLSMLQLMHWGLAIVLLLTLVIESWYIYARHEKINSANEQKNRRTGI